MVRGFRLGWIWAPDDSVTQCEEVSGYVDNDEDCDDNDATVNLGEIEVCDDLDNDCDGEIDGEDAAGASTWYADTDGDGFGDEDSTLDACTAPSGYVSDSTDCDDSTDDANPDEFELCDGIDNDCDGGTDEPDAIDAPTWYDDDDGDGTATTVRPETAHTQPAGYTDIGVTVTIRMPPTTRCDRRRLHGSRGLQLRWIGRLRRR